MSARGSTCNVGGLVHVDRACLEWVQNHEGSHASRGGKLVVDFGTPAKWGKRS